MSQYAFMKFTRPSGRQEMRVLDACELEHLDKAAAGQSLGEPITEFDDTGLPLTLVYGSFVPNKDIEPEAATDHLQQMKRHPLQASLPHRITFLGLNDLTVGPVQRRHAHYFIPVASLVVVPPGAVEFKPRKAQFAITSYLYYGNLTLAENILNRPGVLALKNAERRFPGRITEQNWTEFVDDARMLSVAASVW